MKSIKSKRFLWFGTPVALVLLLAGVGYAISVTTPTSITYAVQTGSTMQGFTADLCSGMDTYTTQVLTDTRNNQNYRVRKMPDGKCWMIDNLKLANYTLTSANSNVSSNFTIPANAVQNGSTRTNGVCVGGTITGTGHYLTCDGTDTQSAANNSYIAYSDPSQAGQGSLEENCQKMNGIAVNSTTGCGYLYNWYTATAGTGTYNLASGNATSSICPAGWTLPTGGGSGQFAVLNNAMATGAVSASTSSTATTRPNWRYNGPFEGSLSGLYYSGFAFTGYGGYYWSSSAYSSTYGYYLSFYFSGVGPGYYTYKYYGFAVRCLL